MTKEDAGIHLYQVWLGGHPVCTIEKVRVVKESPSYLTVENSQGIRKYSRYGPHGFFTNWDEAKEALVHSREQSVASAYKKLEIAQEHLRLVVDLSEEGINEL
jgi:hypothetical protein